MSRRPIHHPARLGFWKPALTLVLLVVGWAFVGPDVLARFESELPSDARGTRANGYLVHGKHLPVSGPNFTTYSRLGSSIGRTCLHGQVRDAMLAAYASVYAKHPAYHFTYGETGWCWGGSFWPHRTHQNGLSVDFMVPVKRKERIVETPTTVLDGFGYASEYDDTGKMGEYQIDFEAMAAHLEALRVAAREHGLAIDQVILEPPLQQELFKTKAGKPLKKRLPWVERAVWVRHDDHYHVDFVVKKKRAAGTQDTKK